MQIHRFRQKKASLDYTLNRTHASGQLYLALQTGHLHTWIVKHQGLAFAFAFLILAKKFPHTRTKSNVKYPRILLHHHIKSLRGQYWSCTVYLNTQLIDLGHKLGWHRNTWPIVMECFPLAHDTPMPIRPPSPLRRPIHSVAVKIVHAILDELLRLARHGSTNTGKHVKAAILRPWKTRKYFIPHRHM